MTTPESLSIPAPPEQPTGGPISVVFVVADQSQVGEVRRRAGVLAAEAGLNDTERGTLAVVATEAATNLARYAAGGIVALRTLGLAPSGVEVLALDRSPGIHDIPKAMMDGYSTGGTAGHGLGAIRRMASEFDLYSSDHTGTALLARIWSARAGGAVIAETSREGVVCVPIAGERVCGDGWLFHHAPNRTLAMIVDGLGHGPDAARAASAALHVVRAHAGLRLARIIEMAHSALLPTRGAAIAIAEVLPKERIVRFAGVGNVSGVVSSASEMRSMVSNHGTMGHTLPTVHEFTYPWTSDSSLIMHSDGIMTRWNLDAYRGLATHHPALLAGVLYRDFTRGRDDASVIVFHGRHQ